MEELKLLISMVSDLPQMALWVLIGYLLYKLAIVGSIFGVIKLAIDKLHDYKVTQKTLPPVKQPIVLEDLLNGICISSDNTRQLLIAQLRRIGGKGLGYKSDSQYIHERTVGWLREAIDDKINKEAEVKADNAN